MRFTVLLIMLTNGVASGSEITLPASRRAHVLILHEVYLNGAGPFRMMVDTGNSSSLVRPALAQKLAIRPTGTVEQVTPVGTRRLPVALLREVRAGAAVDFDIEVMIGEPKLAVDGVLGQSWLVRHDYTIDFHHKRLVLDGAGPEGGIRLPLRSTDGVPQVAGEIDGSRREMVLDSGSPSLVLFGAKRLPLTESLAGHTGSAAAAVGSATVSFPGTTSRRVPAIRVDAPGNSPALLGLSAFASVHVSNREGFVVLLY